MLLCVFFAHHNRTRGISQEDLKGVGLVWKVGWLVWGWFAPQSGWMRAKSYLFCSLRCTRALWRAAETKRSIHLVCRHYTISLVQLRPCIYLFIYIRGGVLSLFLCRRTLSAAAIDFLAGMPEVDGPCVCQYISPGCFNMTLLPCRIKRRKCQLDLHGAKVQPVDWHWLPLGSNSLYTHPTWSHQTRGRKFACWSTLVHSVGHSCCEMDLKIWSNMAI